MPSAGHEKSLIIFNNFSRGEYGLLNPIESGRLLRSGNFPAGTIASSGMWTGTNMTLLPDGSLCPQPMPKAQTTTGLSGTAVDMGMGWDGTRNVLWAKMGNKIYQSNGAALFTMVACANTSPTSTSYIDRCASGTTTYAITSGNAVDAIDHAGVSVAALGGSPPSAATVAQYNDRLMLGGSGGNRNLLYFSAAGNFASWPGNSITVGDITGIVALIPMRGFLLIVKGGGVDSTYWTLRGTPGVNAILRRTSRFQVPVSANNLALLNDNRVAFGVTAAANGNNGLVVPAFFDGTVGQMNTEQMGLLSEALTTETYRMVDSNDVLLKNNLYGLARRRGAWTRMAFPLLVQPNTSNFTATSRTMAADPSSGTFYLMNTAGTAFYKWHPYATRPALSGDTDGAPPDDAPGFTLPEWRAAAGEEVCVSSVVVVFTKWGTGTAGNNTFTIAATSTESYSANVAAGAVAGAGTSSWTEAESLSSVTGSPGRQTFTFAPLWGNGFQLVFSNIIGVAIRSVTVSVSVRPMPGVS